MATHVTSRKEAPLVVGRGKDRARFKIVHIASHNSIATGLRVLGGACLAAACLIA